MTDVNLTQGILEGLFKAGALDVRFTQGVLEVLSVSAAAAAISGTITLRVSGVNVTNAIGLKPLTVSALWTTGSAGFTFNWVFELPVGSATSADITRVFSAGSGILGQSILSGLVSNAAGSSLISSAIIYVRNVGTPNPFDGKYQESNQAKRRVWPL